MPQLLRLAPVPLTLAALWWLLSNGAPGAWVVGAPVVLAASWSAWRLRTGQNMTMSLAGLLRLIPLFLWESLRGGIDVAGRTLAPRVRVRPGFTDYHTALRQPAARVFFANCVCLLPGTLTADLRGEHLHVHLLDSGVDAAAEMQRLERAVARVYRQKDFQPTEPSP